MTLLGRTVLLTSQAETARHLGVSKQYINRLTREGREAPERFHEGLRSLIRKRIEEVAA